MAKHADNSSHADENSSDSGNVDSGDNGTDTGDHEMNAGSDDDMSTGDSEIGSGRKELEDAARAISDGDISVEDRDIFDGPYSGSEDKGAGYYAVGVEETRVLDQREDVNVLFDTIASGATANRKSVNSHERVTNAIKRLRHWLGKLEVELNPIEAELAPKGKRKRTMWQRSSAGGRCWVGYLGGEREEFDGEYLFLHRSTLAVDIVVNTTWLPITLGWNEEKEVFAGEETIGGRILTVENTVMFDAMTGAEGRHFGFISLSPEPGGTEDAMVRRLECTCSSPTQCGAAEAT